MSVRGRGERSTGSVRGETRQLVSFGVSARGGAVCSVGARGVIDGLLCRGRGSGRSFGYCVGASGDDRRAVVSTRGGGERSAGVCARDGGRWL